MKQKIWKIYKVTSPSNKIYIGLTSRSLNERKTQHYSCAKKNGNKSNNHFYNALNKYQQNLKWEIIEEFASERNYALTRERYYIKMYNSADSTFGYNGTFGGDGANDLTPEVKSKIAKSVSIFHQENPRTEEFYKKFRSCVNEEKRKSLAKQARQTTEARQQTSLDSKNRYSKLENRDKMAIACGGKPFHVWKIDGTYIGKFTNQKSFSRDNKLNDGHVNNCLHHRLCQYKGFVFAFEGEKPKLDMRYNNHIEYLVPKEKE